MNLVQIIHRNIYNKDGFYHLFFNNLFSLHKLLWVKIIMNDKYRIVVDAGHGGNDPGAVSGNLREKDFTLQAANYMYNRFKELGVPVTITRDTDKTLTRNERLNTMRSLGTDPNVIVLSNHINAGGGIGQNVTKKYITFKA